MAEAELSYARGLGLSVKRTELGAPLRGRLLGLLAGTEQPERPPRWPLRYGVRRVAWHVTDHLFEIEDRAS